MQKCEQLYEGKAKKVFLTENPDVLIVSYKDDTTAFNGLKKGTIVGKGAINNRMTNLLFQRIEAEGVPTHYVQELNDMVDYLKEYAEGTYSDEEFESLRIKYTYARPFTKESLLYREIFERYYPGQAEMVVDFWMPNKEWEGCDVNDTSARVLSNYGDSGK